MIEYRTVSTHTLKGLKEAERLHQSGWKMGRSGLFTIQFYRQKKKPVRPNTQTQRISGVATTVKPENGWIVVRLYATDVIKINLAGRRAVLNSGGYRTETTKRRITQAMNQYGIPATIWQQAREWFVKTPSGTFPFKDGMEISWS